MDKPAVSNVNAIAREHFSNLVIVISLPFLLFVIEEGDHHLLLVNLLALNHWF
jgi:hypothetical protein|tara:strand:+ start:244 stop:402 length:159 start_codon:yes stop_codon:yes gene_type:complete